MHIKQINSDFKDECNLVVGWIFLCTTTKLKYVEVMICVIEPFSLSQFYFLLFSLL